jgi:hypothetical protein
MIIALFFGTDDWDESTFTQRTIIIYVFYERKSPNYAPQV